MKKRFLAALATGLLVVGMGGVANASLVDNNNYIDMTKDGFVDTQVGYVDDKYASKVLTDGDPSVKAWLVELFGGTTNSYVLDKVNSPAVWADLYQVSDGTTGVMPQVFAYDLPLDSDYFIVKVGTGSAPSGTADHYLFTNLSDREWGVFSYAEMGLPATTNFDMYRVSHITQINGNPVPEPATMLLFGTGLAGLAAVARRRKN